MPLKVPISGTYSVVRMWDGNSFLSLKGKPNKVTINQTQHQIQAYFGCNQMNGSFNTNRYLIEQPIHMVATEMFCTEAINDLEQLFGRGMTLVNHFSVNGNLLQFYQEEQLIFELKKVVKKKKK